jgi:hypothetical protein
MSIQKALFMKLPRIQISSDRYIFQASLLPQEIKIEEEN